MRSEIFVAGVNDGMSNTVKCVQRGKGGPPLLPAEFVSSKVQATAELT